LYFVDAPERCECGQKDVGHGAEGKDQGGSPESPEVWPDRYPAIGEDVGRNGKGER
jgi:hypothetical protein